MAQGSGASGGQLAPLARGAQHGAQCLEGAVGAAGPLGAGGVEPCRDPRVVEAVEAHVPEPRHQAPAHLGAIHRFVREQGAQPELPLTLAKQTGRKEVSG